MPIPQVTWDQLRAAIESKVDKQGRGKYAVQRNADGLSFRIVHLRYRMPDGSGSDQDANLANAPTLIPRVLFDPLTSTVTIDAGSSVTRGDALNFANSLP